MPEVGPGGDNSDSIAEMAGPQNLQTTEVYSISMRKRYKDSKANNSSDSSISSALDGADNNHSQPQYTASSTSTATQNTEIGENAVESTPGHEDKHTKASHSANVNVRQLFVGNLPFRVRWQDLKDMFKKAGEVIRADVAIGFDNRSKGHGTVLFVRVEDAQQAVDLFHNYNWQGRILEVREDRGFIDSDARDGNHHRNTGQGNSLTKAVQHPNATMSGMNTHGNNLYSNQTRHTPLHVTSGRQLFVGNIPFNCQWQDLKDLFRNAGNILRADIAQGHDGRSRGFGTVLYATSEDARNAVAMYDGYDYQGRRLRVHFDKFAPAATVLQPFQGQPELRGRFQDQMHVRSPPFSSRMPYPQHLSMPSVPGMHMYQTPPHMRSYLNPYANATDMIFPSHLPLSNANIHDNQGLANPEHGSSMSSMITNMEQPEQYTSVLTYPSSNSLHGPIVLQSGGSSALGSLDTEVTGLSSYHGAPQLHMGPPMWNGDQHQSLMYRQHLNRTQHPEYPWLHHPISHSIQSDTFFPTVQTDYIGDQLYNNSAHDVENLNSLPDAMATLRFEGTAGLPPNHLPDAPNDSANTKLAPQGIGGIMLSDSMWERQEGSWNTPLTGSFKL